MEQPTTKRCRKCGEEKSLKEGFSPDRTRKDGRKTNCKVCRASENGAAYARKHPRRVLPEGHKHCPGCRQDLPLGDFRETKRSKSGYRTYCRTCDRDRQRDWRERNPEKARARGRQAYARNTEHYLAKGRAWRAANLEKGKAYRRANRARLQEYQNTWRRGNERHLARRRELYIGNPEQYRATARRYYWGHADEIKAVHLAIYYADLAATRARNRARYAANPEAARERQASYRERNPERVRQLAKLRKHDPIKKTAIQRQREARKMGATVGKVDYHAILARDGWHCHICDRDIAVPKHLSFDHVVPLSRDGAHSMDNVKVAHRHCNFRKHKRLLSELSERLIGKLQAWAEVQLAEPRAA